MSTKRLARNLFFALIFTSFGMAVLSSCGSNVEYQEEEVPTQGLITTVQEVQPDEFKIEDEVPIPDTSQSLIIAKYLDGGIDTFTLTEARLMQSQGTSSQGSGIMRAASYGFFGYMIGRSMSRGFRPSASAYRDPNTYNRVNNSTGNTIRSTSQKVSRPSSGSRSGYGTSKSSRSYGG
ncbi:hypothetical protein [Lewinella cohaerens]|uniref:hypothetical protein n=1 Tax=Lewinella cohaerens TaxID=70995 RepID=UPI0003702375|nr:hypothetical protein [Lewinella cohaerens]